MGDTQLALLKLRNLSANISEQIEFMQIELSNILILIRQLIELVSRAYPNIQLLRVANDDMQNNNESV